MKRTTIAVILLLLLGASGAGRAVELLEHAIEAALEDVTLPRGAAGTVIVRACPACGARSLRVSPATRYYIGGARLPAAEFARGIERMALDPDTVVGVFYAPGSDRVTRIKVFAETTP